MLIRLEYSKISSKVSELINVAREVKKEIENMERTVEDLGVFWDSQSEAEYVMRLTADLYSARALLEKVKLNIRVLADTVRKFDEVECQIGELILAL